MHHVHKMDIAFCKKKAYIYFLSKLGSKFNFKHRFAYDAHSGVYKQSGITLIETDCKVFVIHYPYNSDAVMESEQ